MRCLKQQQIAQERAPSGRPEEMHFYTQEAPKALEMLHFCAQAAPEALEVCVLRTGRAQSFGIVLHFTRKLLHLRTQAARQALEALHFHTGCALGIR